MATSPIDAKVQKNQNKTNFFFFLFGSMLFFDVFLFGELKTKDALGFLWFGGSGQLKNKNTLRIVGFGRLWRAKHQRNISFSLVWEDQES